MKVSRQRVTASWYGFGRFVVLTLIVSSSLRSSDRAGEGSKARRREPQGAEEAGQLLARLVDQGAHDPGAALPEVLQESVRHPAADRAAARVGIDAQHLDPPRRLLEPELAGAHLAEHESDDAPVQLGDHRGLRVPPQVITDAALPNFRPVGAGDLL